MYKIEFRAKAIKELGAIQKNDQLKIKKKIEKLAENPFPNDVKKLSNEDEVYRVRVGNYRVLYSIDKGKLIVLVLEVGHRREIYRNLP